MSEKQHHHHRHDEQCGCLKTGTVAQGLDEMEFERGIWSAALYNDLDRLRQHVAHDRTNDRDNFGYTALHYAARQNHADAVRILLAAGATVDAATYAGSVTALHRAASMGCHSIVSTLLAHGANAARCDDDGNTALHRAAGGGHRDAWSVLCAHDSTLLTMANRRQQTALDLVPSDRRDEFEEDVRTSFANQI